MVSSRYRNRLLVTPKLMRISQLRFVFLSLVCSLSFGQTDVGRIVGTVSDPTGAVIPGAVITVKSDKTGQEHKVTADHQGYYIATQLPPAVYTVIGQADGLGPQEYRGLNIAVGQERKLDIVLQPASVATEITISSGGLATVDTSSARIGVNVSEREVAQLPLNGRQVSQLYLMAPGAVNGGAGSFDNIRFSGRSNQQNVIRFDGIEGTSIVDSSPGNLNGESTSLFRLQQSLENVQEFRIDSK